MCDVDVVSDGDDGVSVLEELDFLFLGVFGDVGVCECDEFFDEGVDVVDECVVVCVFGGVDVVMMDVCLFCLGCFVLVCVLC